MLSSDGSLSIVSNTYLRPHVRGSGKLLALVVSLFHIFSQTYLSSQPAGGARPKPLQLQLHTSVYLCSLFKWAHSAGDAYLQI